MLVISCRPSRVLAPWDDLRSIAVMVPNARLEVLVSGHVPWLGRPEEVSRLLSEFAREDSARDSSEGLNDGLEPAPEHPGQRSPGIDTSW